jgi:hypothetical protein
MGPIDQVFAAAEELFSACDRAKFPTVYEVRCESACNSDQVRGEIGVQN